MLAICGRIREEIWKNLRQTLGGEKMRKKFHYQKGVRKKKSEKSIGILFEDKYIEVPKNNSFVKALILEAYLWQIVSNEQEALQIAELLAVYFKSLQP